MDIAEQLAHQYSTSQNLALRIDVHERFSTNPYRWMLWVFDHFDFPESCHILELGCGVGKLWVENAERIRPTWAITVSDFSAAMLAKTKASLADVPGEFDFQQVDVEQHYSAFATYVAQHIQAHGGVLHVEKGGGLFVAQKS